MHEPKAYSYAVVRIVPRVDRDEFINAGVILFSQEHRFLAAEVHLNEARLLALAPDADVTAIGRHLDAIPRICAGDPDAGPIARIPQKDRFHWLTAPRSTTLQISPIRTGLSTNPAHTLQHLAQDLVH